MEKPIVNRVKASGIVTFNLEDYYPNDVQLAEIDIKKFLFKELILKEKDFRAMLKKIDWSQYSSKVVLVYCSTDAIIPVWAYMLVANYCAEHAKGVFMGNKNNYLAEHYRHSINQINAEEFKDKRIVIKGCSNRPVPAAAYMYLTHKLRPWVRSLMYGEPCSTVPIYKAPRK